MPTPSASDYRDAVQNPRSAFADPELQEAVASTDKLGLPRAVTGNTAVVFRMSYQSRTWAVRCFSRLVPEQQARYVAIHDHLRANPLPCFLDFNFQPQGIRVRGEWHPIVRMAWSEGEQLEKYVARHLAQPHALASLASQWVQLMDLLHGVGIAHGDLQHGNVLVKDGQLVLIDYDGMFVPALAGKRALELGHPNYQHPLRSESDFAPALDNFSAWAILVSLLGLSSVPDLWDRMRGGDDCLIFRKQDFLNPFQSPVFSALSGVPGNNVKWYAEQLADCALGEPLGVPGIDVQAPISSTTRPASSGMPAWVAEQLGGSSKTSAQDVADNAGAGAEWVVSEVLAKPAAPSLQFKISSRDRTNALVMGLGVLVPGFLSLIPYMRDLSGYALAVAVMCLLLGISRARHWYDEHPAVQNARLAEHNLAQARNSVESRRRELEEATEERTRRLNEINARIQAKEAECHRLDTHKAAEIRQAQAAASDRIVTIRGELARLPQMTQTERDEQLGKIRATFVQQYLRGQRVVDAHLEGVGAALKAKLEDAGVLTACDIAHVHDNVIVHRLRGPCHVAGIGPAKAAVLATWVEMMERRALERAPQTLPKDREQQIVQTSEAKRTTLENRIKSVQDEVDRGIAGISGRFEAQRRSVVSEGEQLQRSRKTEGDKHAAKVRQLVDELRTDRWNLAVAEEQAKIHRPIPLLEFIKAVLVGSVEISSHDSQNTDMGHM